MTFVVLPQALFSAARNPVSSTTVTHVGCGITQLKVIVTTDLWLEQARVAMHNQECRRHKRFTRHSTSMVMVQCCSYLWFCFWLSTETVLRLNVSCYHNEHNLHFQEFNFFLIFVLFARPEFSIYGYSWLQI